MPMTGKKLLIVAIGMLAFLVVLEMVLSLFVVPLKVSYDPAEIPFGEEYDFAYTSLILPIAIPLDTCFAVFVPVGSAFMLTETIFGILGVHDFYWWRLITTYMSEPLLRPCIAELGVRTALQDFAKNTMATRSFDRDFNAANLVERNCWLYLLIWAILSYWVYLFIKSIRGAKEDKLARTLILVAVLVSPTLWSELLFFVLGIIEPGIAFAIAFLLLLGYNEIFNKNDGNSVIKR